MGGGKFSLHFCMNQTLFKMKSDKIKKWEVDLKLEGPPSKWKFFYFFNNPSLIEI